MLLVLTFLSRLFVVFLWKYVYSLLKTIYKTQDRLKYLKKTLHFNSQVLLHNSWIFVVIVIIIASHSCIKAKAFSVTYSSLSINVYLILSVSLFLPSFSFYLTLLIVLLFFLPSLSCSHFLFLSLKFLYYKSSTYWKYKCNYSRREWTRK